MSVESIKAALGEHRLQGVLCACGWRPTHWDSTPWDQQRAHVAEVIAALMPEASESVEWGVRYADGDVWEWGHVLESSARNAYANQGTEGRPKALVSRTRTTYADKVTEWTEVTE